MDALFEETLGSMNRFRFESDNLSQNLVHDFYNGFADAEVTNEAYSSSPGSGSEGDIAENGHISNTIILKYISEILMEEDLETRPCMLQDCLALQAAEKSFYDVIGQKYPDTSSSCSFNHDLQTSLVEKYPDTSSSSSFNHDLQASLVEKYPDTSSSCSSNQDLQTSLVESPPTFDKSKGKKSSHNRGFGDDPEEEQRRNKHSAIYSDYSEPSDIFDEVLLCRNPTLEEEDPEICSPAKNDDDDDDSKADQKGKSRRRGKTRQRKKRNDRSQVVDLSTLLTQCAQAVASYDQTTTIQLLSQIRQYSSPYGNDTQRLAHYFADGLEARFSAGTPLYSPLGSNGASAADILKSYQVYIKACPFKLMSNFYANRTIAKLAKHATALHIIDFGILYGYQWPCLIQRLAHRPGGPPKLRITGIEFPQSGFRPSERVEQTGRRLANYCQRFNVPFEYSVIAKRWETVKLEELKINRDEEVTVVNCLYRMKNLPDETVIEDCPRDAVLNLIRRISPDLFIHGVVNGTHNAPFFVTRFREALFHFSALFDMFEASLEKDDPHRLMFEREVFGRDVMNVVACEGLQRVERPETYRQWQVRNVRAGFERVALDQELLKRVRNMVKKAYHKDFVVDEDGTWMLQGWKGRIFHAISCWRPI